MAKLESNGYTSPPVENSRKSFVTSEFRDTKYEMQELRKQLAASQARELQLREVINDKQWEKDGNVHAHNRRVQEALAMPSDTTALETLIHRAGEVMRERCAVLCGDKIEDETVSKHVSHSHCVATRNRMHRCAESIRNIPAITLEDINK